MSTEIKIWPIPVKPYWQSSRWILKQQYHMFKTWTHYWWLQWMPKTSPRVVVMESIRRSEACLEITIGIQLCDTWQEIYIFMRKKESLFYSMLQESKLLFRSVVFRLSGVNIYRRNWVRILYFLCTVYGRKGRLSIY